MAALHCSQLLRFLRTREMLRAVISDYPLARAYDRSCPSLRCPSGDQHDAGAIVGDVSQDQGKRKEEDAQQEEPEEAVTFAASDSGGPEGDSHPENGK
jgi:hypothetical protein